MTAWPIVVARLLELLPTLDGWGGVEVYDGPPVTRDAPAEYCTVGFVLDEDIAGSYEPTDSVGDLREETGSVRSEVVCRTGDIDLAAMRARAFALVGAWEESLRKDPTMGVLRPSSTAALTVDVQPQQDTDRTVQRLTVTLSYLARS